MEQTQPFTMPARRPMSATGFLNQRQQSLLSENTFKSPQIELKGQNLTDTQGSFQRRPMSATEFPQGQQQQSQLFSTASRPASGYQQKVQESKQRFFSNISLKAHPNEIISAYEQLLSKENKKRGVKYDLDIVNSMANEIQCLRKEKHDLENQLRLQKAYTGKREAEARSLRRQIDQFAHRPQISLDSAQGNIDIVALSKKDTAPTYEYVKSLKTQLQQLQEANKQYEDYIQQISQSTKVQRINELEKHLNIYYEKFNGLTQVVEEQHQQIEYLASLNQQYMDEIVNLKSRLQAATAMQRIAVPSSPGRNYESLQSGTYSLSQKQIDFNKKSMQQDEQSLYKLQQNLQNSMKNTKIQNDHMQKSSFIDSSMASNMEDDQFDFGPKNLKNTSEKKQIAFQHVNTQQIQQPAYKKEAMQQVTQVNPAQQTNKQNFKSYQVVASTVQPCSKIDLAEVKPDEEIYDSANFHQLMNKDATQDLSKSPRDQTLPPKAQRTSKVVQQSNIKTIQSYSALEVDEDAHMSLDIGQSTKTSIISDYQELGQQLNKKSILSKTNATDEKLSGQVIQDSFDNKSPPRKPSQDASPDGMRVSTQSFQSVQIHDDMFDSGIASQQGSLTSAEVKIITTKMQSEAANDSSTNQQSQIYTSVKVTDDMFDPPEQ